MPGTSRPRTSDAVHSVLLVGDAKCGKSSLVKAFFKTRVPHLPTSSTIPPGSSFGVELDDGDVVSIQFTELSSVRAEEPIRAPYYKTAIAILVCFSAVDYDSLTNTAGYWYYEIKRANDPTNSNAKLVPLFLVGNKADLRPADSPTPEGEAPKDEAEVLGERMRVVEYVECSAETDDGVLELLKSVADTCRRGVSAQGNPSHQQD